MFSKKINPGSAEQELKVLKPFNTYQFYTDIYISLLKRLFVQDVLVSLRLK